MSNIIDTNSFINFKGIFDSLYNYHEKSLERERYVADHYEEILSFVREEVDYNIENIASVLDEKHIEFCFISDTKTNFVLIIYDRILDEFVSFERE